MDLSLYRSRFQELRRQCRYVFLAAEVVHYSHYPCAGLVLCVLNCGHSAKLFFRNSWLQENAGHLDRQQLNFNKTAQYQVRKWHKSTAPHIKRNCIHHLDAYQRIITHRGEEIQANPSHKDQHRWLLGNFQEHKSIRGWNDPENEALISRHKDQVDPENSCHGAILHWIP